MNKLRSIIDHLLSRLFDANIQKHPIPIANDMTTLKEAENTKALALIEIERQYLNFDTMLSSIPDSLVMLDADGNYLYVNRAAAGNLGLSLKELQGKKPSYFEVFPKESLEQLDRNLAIVRKTLSPVKDEGTVDTPSGLRYFEYFLCPIINASGKLTGFTVSNRDVTDRKATEQKLQSNLRLLEQERNFRGQSSQYASSLLEASLDPLVTICPEGKITDVNERSIKVTGIHREKLVGTDFSDYFTEPEKAREGYQKVFAQGFVTDYPLTIKHKDGRLTDVLYNASVYKDVQGNVLGVFAAARDITGRKEIERVREQLLLKEQESNIAKDEFLSTLSHELRTPLTSIMSWAQLLGTGKLDAEKTQRGIMVLQQSAKAQSQLIDDLLDISRIQAGKLILIAKKIDPLKVIYEAVDSTRSLAASKSIQIEMELDPSIKIIFADPHRLQQILWNLITNSIKFSTQGGVITIKLFRAKFPERICLQVCDNGKGIRADFLPIIFERFTQVDSTTTRAFGGLGLGLAIVRKLTELHEGSVEVESPGEGKGAIFSVYLPIENMIQRCSSDADAEAEAEAEANVSLAGLRVLVVEDDVNAREVLTVMLQTFKAEVKAADSVAAAMAIFENFKPDVVVSDIAMPVEDGFKLIERIRSFKSNLGLTPALALTAYAGLEDVQRTHLAGFQSHMAKPADANKLALAIWRLAGKKQSTRYD